MVRRIVIVPPVNGKPAFTVDSNGKDVYILNVPTEGGEDLLAFDSLEDVEEFRNLVNKRARPIEATTEGEK